MNFKLLQAYYFHESEPPREHFMPTKISLSATTQENTLQEDLRQKQCETKVH